MRSNCLALRRLLPLLLVLSACGEDSNTATADTGLGADGSRNRVVTGNTYQDCKYVCDRD